jgi:hypothetical protein
MRILLILGLLAIAGVAQAQIVPEWTAVYDAGKSFDVARDIVTDAAGNIYVTGRSDIDKVGIVDYAAVTVKYNSAGEQLWLRRLDLDTNASDQAHGIALDSAGNVVIGGEIFVTEGVPQATTRRMFVAKYDAEGNLLWSKIQPSRTRNDRKTGDFTAIAVDPQGNVILTGYGQSSGNQWDYLIYRFRPNGELAWFKNYGSPSGLIDELQGLALDDTGNVYVTGTMALNENNLDPMTIKYDTAGKVVWQHKFGYPRIENMRGIQVDRSGNTYVTGYMGGGFDGDSLLGVLTIKYDPKGAPLWSRLWRAQADSGATFGGSVKDLKLDHDTNLYFLTQAGGQRGWHVVKYNTDGQFLWESRHETLQYYSFEEIALDGAGNIYLAGTSNFAWRLRKFNAQGDFLWEASYALSSSNNPELVCWGVAVDRQGNAYFCGSHERKGEDLNFVTIKFAAGAGGPASVADVAGNGQHSLAQNHPNPFSGVTTIDYTIPTAGYVRLALYDLIGREIARPVDGNIERGTYHVSFDAGELLPGNYIYRLESGGESVVKVMSVVQ